MESPMGLAHFWNQGDLVTHTTAIILALLSLASWSVIISKGTSDFRFPICSISDFRKLERK